MTTMEKRIDDLLAQFAAAQTYAEYMPLRSRCVQALDSYETGAGLNESRPRQWKEFERICSTVGPAIRKREYDSIRIYSSEELRAYQASVSASRGEETDPPVNLLDAVRALRSEPAAADISLNTITDFMCAVVAASTSLDSAHDAPALQAAE